MYGPSDANRRLRRVVEARSVRWGPIARRSATAFLAAGVLLLATAVLTGLAALTSASPPRSVTGATGLVGVILSYVGLLGVYPRVVDGTPRLARTGAVLVALPVLALLVLLVWGALGHGTSAVPVPIVVIPAIGVVFVASFLLFALGTTLFGVAGLRSGRLPRAVASLLFAYASTWFLHLGATTVYGSRFPVWFDSLTFGLLSVVTLAIGYHLRSESGRTDRTGPSPDSAP